MHIQQIYTGCLSQASYYIESNGEAAIVDPIRDVEGYIQMAEERKAKIKYILETHFHADFVSGHVELLKQTGAKIIYGPGAKASYEIVNAKDGQELPLGKASIKVIHTPGHTFESSCYLAIDENDKPLAVFTGDTLFVGEVGRVDLAAKSNYSAQQMAGMLFDSLEKLKSLADEVIVYPGHGAGSACGKKIGKETTSTIKDQKQNNYALQPMPKEEFIKIVSEGIPAPPKYFFTDVQMNHEGYVDETKLAANVTPLSLDVVKKEMQNGTTILDTRNTDEFGKGHIPGSINVSLDGQFAVWVGNLFDNIPFVIVCDHGKEKESITRLARIGYDKVKGFLHGGVKAWTEAGLKLQAVENIHATEFVKHIGKDGKVLDVRNEDEFLNGVVNDATMLPLAKLEANLSLLDKNAHYYVHCRSGYRSMIASSILQKNGFSKITNVIGGMNAIAQTGIKLEVPETV